MSAKGQRIADRLAAAQKSGFIGHRAELTLLRRRLSGLFLEMVPNAQHREAIDVCAVARVTSQPLLIELFGEEGGRAVFEWLRRQSFVESGPRGLLPHDLVREVILAEARWRDAAALGRLSRRIYTTLHRQIAAAGGRERQRLQMDALYVTRIRPTNASFFDWNTLDEARVEPAEAGDRRWILDLVSRHEGPESADLARRWWRAQPADERPHARRRLIVAHVTTNASPHPPRYVTRSPLRSICSRLTATPPLAPPANPHGGAFHISY